MNAINRKSSNSLLENINELERKLAEADRQIKRLTDENTKLKTTNQELKISHPLEAAFYETGGKRSTSELGTSAFDLLYTIAKDYVNFDDRGNLSFINPQDGLKLKNADGRDFTARDLMQKLKSSPVTGTMFESSTANDYSLPNGLTPGNITRESLRQIKDPAARLALAREHGIS